MLNTRVLDDIAAKLGEVLANSPAKDFEKNARAVLTSMLARLDLVTRDEFEVQKEILARTRERMAALEARLDKLESAGSPTADNATG